LTVLGTGERVGLARLDSKNTHKHMKKRYYYQFWLQSSGQTDAVIMRRYDVEPTKEQLKEDVEEWCQKYGAWQIADHLSYGWRPVVPPRSRKIALARYQAACKLKNKWNEKCRLYAGFLQYL
jgi:hypothetical protein